MKNDTMVPLDSQLSRWSSIEKLNLSGVDDNGSEIPRPEGCINTIQYVLSKTAHAWNIPILHADVYIQKGTTVFDSNAVISCITEFIVKEFLAAQTSCK